MGPPSLRAARPKNLEAGSIDSRAARTIPGPAQSIAMIVATPELIATECNRCPGWPDASFRSSTSFWDFGNVPGRAWWPGGSDAYDRGWREVPQDST